MTENYEVLTTNPQSDIELHPGTLYFADFELSTPVGIAGEANISQYEEDFFKSELKRSVRLKADEDNINLEIDMINVERSHKNEPGVRLVTTGTMDPSEHATELMPAEYIYGYRVYFHVYSTPVHAVIAVFVAATLLMGATWAVLYTGTPVLLRICRATENVAVAAKDVLVAGLKTPGE